MNTYCKRLSQKEAIKFGLVWIFVFHLPHMIDFGVDSLGFRLHQNLDAIINCELHKKIFWIIIILHELDFCFFSFFFGFFLDEIRLWMTSLYTIITRTNSRHTMWWTDKHTSSLCCACHIIYWPFNLSYQFVKINNIQRIQAKMFWKFECTHSAEREHGW